MSKFRGPCPVMMGNIAQELQANTKFFLSGCGGDLVYNFIFLIIAMIFMQGLIVFMPSLEWTTTKDSKYVAGI